MPGPVSFDLRLTFSKVLKAISYAHSAKDHKRGCL